MSRVWLSVGAGDHDGSVVGQVGQGLPDRDGGDAGEQVRVARWQPVVALVEELVGERLQVGGLTARIRGVEQTEEPWRPWLEPAMRPFATFRRRGRRGRRVGDLGPQVERLLGAGLAGQRRVDQRRAPAGARR